jgi:hypothetical protein
MRKNFTADWAFGIKGAIENSVRATFPQDLRGWPLLQKFNFEAYTLPNNYMVIVLIDKLSGITAGPGIAEKFPYDDYPSIPPKSNEMEIWQFYLRNKFKLRIEDAAFLFPIYNSGIHSAAEDYKLFSVEEQYFWDQQIKHVILSYKTRIQAQMVTKPDQPTNITYNVSGTNTRVNINSNDSSVNIVNSETTQIFTQLRDLVEQIEDVKDKEQIMQSIDSMESSVGTADFINYYQQFMSFISNHITVFSPLLPVLASLLA